MSNNCVLPLFSIEEVSDFLAQLYGISGSVIPLNGERDLNFRVSTESRELVFKVANIEEDPSLLECQDEIFTLIENSNLDLECCQTVLSLSGKAVESMNDKIGDTHFCRLVTFIDGRLFSDIKPHTELLLGDLGYQVAGLSTALKDFKHTAIERPLVWNMMAASETICQFQGLLASSKQRELVASFHQRFERDVLPLSKQLDVGAIHNDINDNNIIVEDAGVHQQSIKSFIDFGDIVYSWVIVDLAVTCAYSILGKDCPLDAVVAVLKGYQRQRPLTEAEVTVLFDLICMRLCLSVCICAHQKSIDPDNQYLSISERPAWAALEKLSKLNSRFVYYLFRDICGMEPVPQTPNIKQWVVNNSDKFYSIVNIDLSKDPLLFLDTSVGSSLLSNPSIPFDPNLAERDLFRAMDDGGFVAAIGGYDEYRLIYNSDDFTDETGHRRTLHLGIDIFQSDGSEIYAPLDGEVFGVANNDSPLDYGGTIILKHQQVHEQEEIVFYTLYGHLKPSSVMDFKIGEKVQGGNLIGVMGDTSENGNWVPHVHFEIITDMLEYDNTFVGVGTHAHRNVWLNLCPDPSILLGLREDANPLTVTDPDLLQSRILDSRSKNLNPSLSLSYDTPIHMVRGDGQYMFDYTGRRYLDAVNNVPHVGHSHPKVVEAAYRQAKTLNTNTRYLYNQIESYSEKLLEMFPKPLEVCYLVNSGSEANDLALRLATNYTQKQDRIILDHAYHGNLSSLIDISPYKHNARGGQGAPDYVHTALIPDTYRGKYLSDTQKYVKSVDQLINQVVDQSGLAFFIAESVLGCGGQVVLPEGYLSKVYDKVRAVGGLCIADEVQVGLGRVGNHIWAFETQAVVPDIVTLGKPMGNGHPLAAVITTREIAESFNNGMEYFNTFGGNPVSCAIGQAVLEVFEEEQLQANALEVGNYFMNQLSALKSEYEIIGDVRGLGLFLGVELVNSRETLAPAAMQSSYVIERMKQKGILISTDGPLHNVLKIKPPMCFNQDNVAQFIGSLELVLQEDYAQIAS